MSGGIFSRTAVAGHERNGTASQAAGCLELLGLSSGSFRSGSLGCVLRRGPRVGGSPLPGSGAFLRGFLSASAFCSSLKTGVLGGCILCESGRKQGRQVHVRELPNHPQREQAGDRQGREQYLERVVFPTDGATPPCFRPGYILTATAMAGYHIGGEAALVDGGEEGEA